MLRYALAACAALILLSPAASADANLAVGLAQVRAGNEDGARAAMARIEEPALQDVILWHLLRARKGSFAEAEAFLQRNADWPGLTLLRRQAEASMPATLPPQRILDFFDETGPKTARGALMQAVAFRSLGGTAEAELIVIDWWLREPMPPAVQAGFLRLFGDTLKPYHAARLDAMAWSGDLSSAERMLPLVEGPENTLAKARIALRDMRNGVDDLIEAVPEDWRDHQGLAYERFRWRLEKGRTEDALKLLFAYDESADTLGSPEAWAPHRERLARTHMQDGDPETGYRIAANHHLPDGNRHIAGNEWLAGYIALRFLDKPDVAAAHFRRFETAVNSPISKGRAGYWLGRALAAAGDAAGAKAAYAAGGRYQTSFYGQLAAEAAGLPADPNLAGTEVFAPLADTSLVHSSVLKAARTLQEMGERNLAERFMTHMAEGLPRPMIGTLIDVALDMEEPHIALMIAKRAAREGHELHKGYFPVTDLAALESPVAAELSLSIARRESEFDPVVMSHAGARGLMQLMPGTAREMSSLIGEPYALGRLTADPLYNARLGTAYLGELEAEFGPSAVLVPAAYNAGPSRARRWSRVLGNPADPDVDIVDWIEDVPFSETRNYIMRVSESLLPYRARLMGEPGPIRLTEWLTDGYGDLAPTGSTKAARDG
ncbi:MAG: lytic transglycosylase domain-containing protein [Pseudomonadota bacterium]